MLFLEEYAPWLLVLHTALGVSVVAASTHLVVWMRGYPKRRFRRYASIRRFAYIALSLWALNFVAGNLVYPVYKVRVRMEFFENPAAVARAASGRRQAAAELRERVARERNVERSELPAEEVAAERGAAERLARVARWFDVKEHWAALGLALSAAVALILTFWRPQKEPALASIVFGMALGAAGSAWLAAIVGVVTASFRSVGGL